MYSGLQYVFKGGLESSKC